MDGSRSEPFHSGMKLNIYFIDAIHRQEDMMNDVRVEVSYRLSNESETRYVVVDAMTGRVVDSAKGYGYTSYKKALACYRWKHEKLRKGMI